jgi:hypothetical protein
MIERMLDKGRVWFAPMREIAAHVRRCMSEGTWSPRIDSGAGGAKSAQSGAAD